MDTSKLTLTLTTMTLLAFTLVGMVKAVPLKVDVAAPQTVELSQQR